MSVMEREYLTPSQAAARAGVSSQTVKNWYTAGRLPGLLTPLGRLFVAADVDRVIQERRERPSGDAA